MNVRGPCSSCGMQLATDQRYCVECGQRVGPPLALPYSLPVPTGEPPAATGWLSALPIPIQRATTFAAIALGFGVVVGTAISPNLADIVAAPSTPTVVAQPPTESPSTSAGGGGSGSGAPAPAPAPAATPLASAFPASSGGGGGAGGEGGHPKQRKKKSPGAPATFSGTVVRINPVAQSYTISATNGLIAVHADMLPKVGDQVESQVRPLANGTYAEISRTATGTADVASFHGTVTYCADLERPAAACDGRSPTDHYVYAVSSLGASVLVSWPHSAASPPPKIGAQVQVGVQIGDPFQPAEPDAWATDQSCTPAYDEQSGHPHDAVKLPELTQTSINVTAQATSATAEAVVQTVCPGDSPKLVLSADDVREASRDLGGLGVPPGIDLAKLSPGEAVQFAVDIAADGEVSLRGITSDQGAAGADDSTQGQGSLAGS